MRTYLQVIVVFLPLASLSCSSKDKKAEEFSKGLAYVGRALLTYSDDHKKPATTPDQLKEYLTSSDFDPEPYLAKIKSGELVVVWGVTMQGLYEVEGGYRQCVILYEKDAPTKGGHVVMGDLNVKKVTAEEFKTLKLAPRK